MLEYRCRMVSRQGPPSSENMKLSVSSGTAGSDEALSAIVNVRPTGTLATFVKKLVVCAAMKLLVQVQATSIAMTL